MKVLIIEDDKQTAETLRDELRRFYAVDVALTGEEGDYLAHTNEYDVALVDLVLPDIDGVRVCRRIRESGIETPILMLTGQSEVEDKVRALDAGADDYLTKPFSFEELLARVRALMRRSPHVVGSNEFRVGDLTLNVEQNTVERKGEVISLRKKEFSLLEYLMRNVGYTLTRNMILEHVWDSGADPVTNTVDVHINYLRDKIDRPYGTRMIKTVHGLGYKIEK